MVDLMYGIPILRIVIATKRSLKLMKQLTWVPSMLPLNKYYYFLLQRLENLEKTVTVICCRVAFKTVTVGIGIIGNRSIFWEKVWPPMTPF